MRKLIQVTATGEEHGCLKVVANSEQTDGFKNMKPETKAKAEKMKKEEAKIVKGRYINHMERNGKLEMPYSRWGGEPISMWRFLNGFEYDVPMGLINQVNGTYFNKRSERVDPNTKQVTNKDSRIKQHEFVAVGF